jgi:hypothetical protein
VRKSLGHAFAWLIWVAVLWWFWMLLVAEWSTVEIVAASCVSVVAATFAEIARAKDIAPLRIPREWLSAAKTVPLVIVADFGIITWVLVRALLRRERIEGAFRVKPFPPGGAPERAKGIRAWVTLTATYSPNAYVIDIDPDHSAVLLHDLLPREFSEEPA